MKVIVVSTIRFLVCVVCFLGCSLYSIARSPQLLPEPQEAKFGQGKVYLENTVQFVRAVEKEDTYVLAALNQILEEHQVQKADVVKTALSRGFKFDRVGATAALPNIDERVGRDSREYYRIQAEDSLISITAFSSAGLFYAVQTLRQLVSYDEEGVFVPEVWIEDWPMMPYRGFMMDMTHMQFPTMEEIKAQIDFLSRWKINQYYFYSEANIELEGYPLLMPRARFTKLQIKEIIDYAEQRFVDVVPNINLYGHLHDVFKYEHYSDLAATPYGQEFKVDHPQGEGIINDWIDQFSSIFTSPFFHIGFDETYLIKYEAERLGIPTDELFLKMLNRTVEAVEKKGKKAMFYSDRLRLFPEGIPKIEGKPVVVSWRYRKTDPTYDDFIAPFMAYDLPVFVQSGSLNYLWLYPDVVASFENNYAWIESAQKLGAKGFIMSGWTDSWNALMRLTRPDMVHGAVVSWQKRHIENKDFFELYCQMQYPDSIVPLLSEAHLYLAESAHISRKLYSRMSEQIWADPFSESALKLYTEHKDELRRTRLLSEKAQIHLMEAMKSGVDTTTLYSILVGAKLLDYLAAKQLFAGRISDLYNEYKEGRDKQRFGAYMAETYHFFSSLSVDMHNMIVENKEIFTKAWRNEYTDFRLGIALGHFDKELHNWFAVQSKLQRLNRLFEANEPFPPIQEYLDIDWD